MNARKGLTQATVIAPGEPASWADLGLLQFKQQDYEGAFASVVKAQALVPQNSRIEALLGVIESRRGKSTEALNHLERAVTLDGGNLKALYGLAGETERQNGEKSDEQAQQLLEKILTVQPNNLAVLVDLVRLSAKRNDAGTLQKTVSTLRQNQTTWPQPARDQLAALEKQAAGASVRQAAVQAQFLRNVLVRVPAYRQSLDEVKTPVTSAGEPFLRFLKLPSPSSDPSPPDTALTFQSKPLDGIPVGASWLGTFIQNDKSPAEVIWADRSSLHVGSQSVLALPGKGIAGGTLLDHNAVLAADLNYDFKTDIVLATPAGLKIYLQTNSGQFEDVAARTGLPPATLKGAYSGAWAFDYDLDGDLDLVLGSPSGEPLVLRNNGDGTFRPVHVFDHVNGLRAFTTADIDGDGDPDVALLDNAGGLHVFANERLGDFRERPLPRQASGQCLTITSADANGDGLADFVLLKSNGLILRLSDRSAGHEWSVGQLATAIRSSSVPNELSLVLADLDNNGALDLVVGDQILLGDGSAFHPLAARLPSPGNASIEGRNGRLDLLALSPDGHAFTLANSGRKSYGWQDVRPKAASTNGDQRINSFGFGGEIEIRADLLTEKQSIESPLLHFGLGDHPGAQFARIVWPNGIIQTEFALKADQTLVAEQRLKGSCPLLYAWNGCKVQFVKDVAPMSGALGAHDGDGRFAPISQTEEWFKISGEQLAARDGYYDLRVTDEYWEAYFIDGYSLRSVDHPPGTQVFVDERVSTPAAPLKLYVTGPLRSFASAHDERGHDVLSEIDKLDNVQLDTFEPGAYQGVAGDHWVELEVPPDAPRNLPLYLIGDGWLHPWDDSILVAVNQGAQSKPTDLSIEVPDRNGRWHPAATHLGVPAGRAKAIVLEISSLFRKDAPRKLRLRTNLEIYWDRLQWAASAPAETAAVREQPLPLESAVLRPRGFSQILHDGARSPETPQYEQIVSSGGKWQAIEGYYTRYGDVRALLEHVDDRFVIAGSGDELRMKFKEGREPPSGWQRDYIFIGDGWMKEGDYSFKASRTLLPLPYHGMTMYNSNVTGLEHDPAFLLHPYDWQNFHTRYVASEPLSLPLWSKRNGGLR